MNSKEEFENKIGRLTKSKAYLDFCEEVCGYRMYFFNMMDKEQLDFVFHKIPLTSNDNILDIGCGSGSVLSFLADKYGCSGTGIDQLENEYFTGNHDGTVRYMKGDIDRLSNFGLNPTVVLSIDSLYFSNDLNSLINTICCYRNCRKYFFYSQYIFDAVSSDRSILHGDRTSVADILNKNRIEFSFIDYSRNENQLYEKSLTVLEKRRDDFCAEGNEDLYKSKRNEALLGKQLYDNGLASRFLYIVE
jgi:SAM-dependent methyltransferase